jgi:hypothetical protein
MIVRSKESGRESFFHYWSFRRRDNDPFANFLKAQSFPPKFKIAFGIKF